MLRRGGCVLLLALAAAGPAVAAEPAGAHSSARVEVIAELSAPAAARAPAGMRTRAVQAIDRQQRGLAARILATVPEAELRWRYRLVLDGMAVVLPAGDVGRLAALPGVRAVYPSVRYHGLTGDGPGAIGAPAIWGPGLENAGRGIKIGIIDDGVDASHPYFDPAGFEMPPGYPKGVTAYTTAKVIVARSFAPAGAGWKYAGRPFDPVFSSHGTHVAGIAAGDSGTRASSDGAKRALSGVAPLAYLGNYKALSVPTDSGVGLDGNSPEIVAAIEAAVADGMDVINLSLGEPDVEPSRDAVAKALDAAAAAGVVPVVAAGNEFEELGRGSVGSPGTSEGAITVAAVSDEGVVAAFSSGGPTAFALAGKPDVAAPGVDVLSAEPGGRFQLLSGTSMAAPHVAGAAALLRELHPDWTVEQLKSALVLTGAPVWTDEQKRAQAPSTRSGGGLVDLPAAAAPLVFASPLNLSFGFLDVSNGSASVTRDVQLGDAGGGGGTWALSVEEQSPSAGVTISAPASVTVPGAFQLVTTAGPEAPEVEHSGFVVLERAGVRRRLPFWFRVTRPLLSTEPFTTLVRDGTYRGDTSGGESLVRSYRYPDRPTLVPNVLAGPERVFRVQLDRPVANLGAAVVGSAAGVRIEPRLVLEANENRLAGPTGIPFVGNPYLRSFLSPSPVVATLLPAPGAYAIVFDTPSSKAAGRFTFRLWIDDVIRPTVRLLSRVARGGRILARLSDGGSGVDPDEITYQIDRREVREGRLTRGGIAVLDVSGVRPGKHRLLLVVSDRQEAKNNENVPQILPNTRISETTISVPQGAP